MLNYPVDSTLLRNKKYIDELENLFRLRKNKTTEFNNKNYHKFSFESHIRSIFTLQIAKWVSQAVLICFLFYFDIFWKKSLNDKFCLFAPW